MARRPRLRFLLRLAAVLALAAGAASVWLCFQAERKLRALALGGLGESFSTRVWSAPYVLPQGGWAEPARLMSRLGRLSYRKVETDPVPGEFRWQAGRLEVHLRGFSFPPPGQPEGLYVLKDGGGEWSISDSAGGRPDAIRLEPELVTELSGSKRVRRDPLAWEQIPEHLIDAVIAAEDKRFWRHHGLDPRAIARATLKNFLGRDLQGASTITQQLSKNLFLSPQRSLKRKAAEAGLAVYLELRMEKRRILTLYLNHIYMGQDGPASVMGMRAAARHYFAKDTERLTLAEAATLAGIIRGPGLYNPFRDPAPARVRRDQVLRLMRDQRLISEPELESALAEPLKPIRGVVEEDRREHAYYVAEVLRLLIPRYGGDALYRNGLSIHTTMDPVLQSFAQKTLKPAKWQAALAAMDPATGAVLALAGGKDYSQSQFNRATQAQRQPGSAFKPFVFAAGLKTGLTPATILSDVARSYPGEEGGEWSPENYDGVYHGTATMRQALARSLNAATLDLAERAGLGRIRQTARDCGIASPLRSDLGVALGASEVGLLELTAAYAPFAALGRRTPPRLVYAVLDSEGLELERSEPSSAQVLDPPLAYVMSSLMGSVIAEGTARSLPALGVTAPAAGKTGTTNEGRDAWFVGFTSSTLAGVWVGDDENRALKLTGAKDALPLWAAFMKEAAGDRPAGEFARPDGVEEAKVCPESGMLAKSGCPKAARELFVAGTEPRRECLLHRGGLKGWWDWLRSREP